MALVIRKNKTRLNFNQLYWVRVKIGDDLNLRSPGKKSDYLYFLKPALPGVKVHPVARRKFAGIEVSTLNPQPSVW